MTSTAQNKTAKRDRVVTSWFLTVELNEVYDIVREDFVNSFEDVVSYCCAVETSVTSSRVSNHLHCYLELNEGIKFDDMRDYVSSLYDGLHIDVQRCKSKRNALKYITKEDRNVYSNISPSKFHIQYRMYFWALNSSRFDFTDPFVVEHRNQYRFLQKYYEEVKVQTVSKFNGFRVPEFCYSGWALKCCLFWRENIKPHYHKRKSLYLWGCTNTGKTTLVEYLIGRSNLGRIFYPGVGKFFMQGLDERQHEIIIFEEFDVDLHLKSMLKRLLEGKPYAYPVKCEPDKIITWKKPIIFISNHNIRYCGDEALLSRLYIVDAIYPFWQNAVYGPVPKEEAIETPEVIEISDTEMEEAPPPSV